MLVAPHAVGVAVDPLNATVLLPWEAPKFAPVIVTEVPTGPVAGLRLVMDGAGLLLPAARKATICMIHDWIFKNVAIASDAPAGITSSRSRSGRLNQVRTNKQIVRAASGHRSAIARRRRSPLRAGRNVQRIYGIEAAVLRDADIR